jgi:hypothetical protein
MDPAVPRHVDGLAVRPDAATWGTLERISSTAMFSMVLFVSSLIALGFLLLLAGVKLIAPF